MANKIEMTSTTSDVSPMMLETTKILIRNLTQSKPFLQSQKADRKLLTDRTAMQLLTDLAKAQEKIREQQYSNTITDNDLERLRKLQDAVQSNNTILTYRSAQQKAIALLREVNDEISALIGIDFASLTRRPQCCG